jgi:hypothetical protein
MTASSPTTPVQLSWVKSNLKGRYELTANGPILGSCSVLASGNQPAGLNLKTNHGLFNDADWAAPKFSSSPETEQ